MLLLAPLMRHVPLAALAAVLLVVAWNMSEHEAFRNTLSAPKGDWRGPSLRSAGSPSARRP